jgi:carboxypeptidase family protein
MFQIRLLAAAVLSIGLAVDGAARPADPPVAPTARAGASTIMGSVRDVSNNGVPSALVSLRNMLNGKIEATVRTDNAGQFTLANLEGGNYLLELVNEKGRVLVTGQPIAIAQGETVATILRLGATKIPWFAGFFGSSASIVSGAAAAAGVTAIAAEAMRCVSACAGDAR